MSAIAANKPAYDGEFVSFGEHEPQKQRVA